MFCIAFHVSLNISNQTLCDVAMPPTNTGAGFYLRLNCKEIRHLPQNGCTLKQRQIDLH